MNILKGFALALSMLSTIAFFKVHNFYKGINGYAVMFYPLIGFLLGGILYGIWVLLHPLIPSVHLGILLFGISVLLTGAIHLDGLSDTIDGLFVDRTKALEVMKDPHTGGMGMLFSTTFLILKASSLAFLDAMYLLPIIFMLSRFNALLAIYLFPYISQNGIATLAKEELKLSQVFVAFFYVIILSLLFSSFTLLLISLLILFVLKLFFIKRYGGFSGDIYGFSIETTELILLNILIIGLV